MKKHIVILSVASMAFSSCEKVIDLKLNNTSAQLVIQGNIYDTPGPYTVKISRTVDFDASNEYPTVSGATVVISDDHGNTDTLTESVPGTYATSITRGSPGYTYTLTASTGGVSYSAVSKMPKAVSIDSIYMGDGKQVAIKFKDSVNIDNYYRFILFVNDKQQSDFYVVSDDLYDGDTMSYSFRNNDDKFKSGDNVTVRLEAIDEGVYEYFRTSSSSGGGLVQSASPANPTSNISNGALGYFNACSGRTSSIVIP